MGNCFRKNVFITDKYLFEPLNSNEESCFIDDTKCNTKACLCLKNKEQLDELTNKIEELNQKINILDNNTRENLKSISDDIYYINEKQTQNSIEQNDSKDYASFINDN